MVEKPTLGDAPNEPAGRTDGPSEMQRMLMRSLAAHFGIILSLFLVQLIAVARPLPPRVYTVNLTELPGAGAKIVASSSAPIRATAKKAERKGIERKKNTSKNRAKATVKTRRAAMPKPVVKKSATLRRKKSSKVLAKAAAKPRAAKREEAKNRKAAAAKPAMPAASKREAPKPATPSAASIQHASLSNNVARRGKWTRKVASLASGNGFSTDAADFPFLAYLRVVRHKVYEHFHVSGLDRSSGDVRKVVVYFQVGRDGRIINLRMETSSGSEIVDRSAVNAVQSAAPLPPLPESYPEDLLGVHFGFEWVQQG